MQTPEEHFNGIAEEYEYWKSKNRYYYDALKALLVSLIPPGARVAEIGCGTGDLLLAVEPKGGRGIDISEAMVALAVRKHKAQANLSFERADMVAVPLTLTQDYLFMTDVLEHVEPLPQFLESVYKSMKPGARLIVTLANPRWEWLLLCAETFGMKMPEGPHWRLSIGENEDLYRRAGFMQITKGFRLLIPRKLPFSDWINAHFYKSSLLASWGFIVYWVLVKKGEESS